jgi:hypothetical protein
MPFIPPMLATRLEDPRRLADPRYIAEHKRDGQRAQLHFGEQRTPRLQPALLADTDNGGLTRPRSN